jgi:hypothetical protein
MYTLRVSSTSKSLGLIMAKTITRLLGSLYYLVFSGLLLLLLFLESVLAKDLLGPLGAPLEVTFYPLLISSCLRLF